MNRPIKFRAWDKKEGAMTAPLYDHAPLVGSINVNIVIEHLQSSDSTLMQFTGLLDKNGKEIYEGDIVKPLGCLHDGCDLPVMSVAEVSFWQDGWHLFSNDEKDRLWHYCRSVFDGEEAHHNKVEVIGNIYENPELLE